MRRSHPSGPFVALVAANENGPVIELPTPLARRGTRLCGTVIAMPPSAVEELRNLHAHRRRNAEALMRLVDGRGALKDMLEAFR